MTIPEEILRFVSGGNDNQGVETFTAHRKPVSRIEHLRRDRGLRQADLAEAVGVSKSYIGMVESGWVPPPHRQDAFAEALRVEVTDLWLRGRAR